MLNKYINLENAASAEKVENSLSLSLLFYHTIEQKLEKN